MRSLITFALLLLIRYVSKIFWRHDSAWVGDVPERPWRQIRVVAILNHTSLYEPIFAAVPPNGFFWRLSHHGVVPVAEKTTSRPIIGVFFRLLAHHVVPISRQRDHTWEEVLAKIDDPRAMVVILPEGRMKRRNGLDSHGRPMSVRSGIADILRAVPEGRMLLAYSGGLHHIQAPGERRWPHLFKRVRLRLESVDIPTYRRRLLESAGKEGFTSAVIEDLTRRRDRYCFPESAV